DTGRAARARADCVEDAADHFPESRRIGPAVDRESREGLGRVEGDVPACRGRRGDVRAHLDESLLEPLAMLTCGDDDDPAPVSRGLEEPADLVQQEALAVVELDDVPSRSDRQERRTNR